MQLQGMNLKRLWTSNAVCLALAGAVLGSGSEAAVINLSFHNGTTTLSAMAPASNPTTMGAVVNTAASTWNDIVNNGGVGLSFSSIPLYDAAGVLSGATLAGESGFSGYNSNGWGSGSKDHVMMEGWYGFRATESLTITGLPEAFTAQGYKVIVYGDANTSSRTMNYTLAGVTRTIADGGIFSGDFTPFSVAFTGLSNASFTITGNPGASDARSAINGLQIVSNPGPPPPPPPGAIGVNFHHSTAGALAPTDAAGVILMAGWNNLDVGSFGNFTNYPFTDTALLYADGSASGAILAISLGSGYNGSPPTGNLTPDHVLMSEYISWDPIDGTDPEDPGNISVAGLGEAFTTNGYDVLVYFDANTTDRTFTVRIGSHSAIGQDAATFSGTYIRAFSGNLANYAHFRSLTESGFTLEMDSTTGRAAVNALQIVPRSSVPAMLSIDRFAAAPGRIGAGERAVLSWEVADATTIRIEPEIGDVTGLTTNGVGLVEVWPDATTEYTLVASNSLTNLEMTATARIVVGPPVPNLVLFLVDDMGWQDTSLPFHFDAQGQPVVSALNQRYRTPAMETLAARGLRFTAAYAAPVCTPTRVAIMTGKNTARHRVTNWTTPTGAQPSGSNSTDLQPPSNWRLTGISSNEIALPNLLRSAGYRTIHAGKAHFGSAGYFGQYPQNLGFEVNIAGREIGHPASYLGTANFGSGTHHVFDLEAYHGQDIFLTEALTLEMNQRITRAVTDHTPFFAYLAHYAVHSPFTVDQRFAANYPGLSGSELAFATMIEGMDKSLGDILAKLEELGVAEETLVVFMSDNGGDMFNTPLRNKKGTLYEGGVRVPLIVSWARSNPDHPLQAALPIQSGSLQHDSVLAWDLFPTLLSLAGIAPPAGIDGHDLAGYLRGTPDFHRPQQFAIHFPHHRSNGAASQNPGTVWRDGDWKLIYDYQNDTAELYNLADDLAETNQVAGQHPDRVMAMSRAMARELQQLGAQFPEFISTGLPVPLLMPNLPQVDLDGDGLPDLTEDANADGLLDPAETDPDHPDSDRDGTQDGAEWRTGTDPLDASSNFVALLAVTNGAPATIAWPGKTGAQYRIESSPSLEPGAWSPVADDIAGQDGSNSYALPAPAAGETKRFYRVVLK